MKKWVLLIFGINESLDKRCEVLSRRIDRLSLNPALPAAKLYSEIIALNNKKADLVNLRVIYNLMAESLSGEERLVVKELADRRRRKRQLETLGKSGGSGLGGSVLSEGGLRGGSVRSGIRGLGVGCKTLAEIFKTCEAVIAKAGYSVQKLEQIYPYFISRVV